MVANKLDKRSQYLWQNRKNAFDNCSKTRQTHPISVAKLAKCIQYLEQNVTNAFNNSRSDLKTHSINATHRDKGIQ